MSNFNPTIVKNMTFEETHFSKISGYFYRWIRIRQIGLILREKKLLSKKSRTIEICKKNKENVMKNE
jgi:hypothetical protein